MKLNVTKLLTTMFTLHEIPNLRQIICHANVLLLKIMHIYIIKYLLHLGKIYVVFNCTKLQNIINKQSSKNFMVHLYVQ